MNMQSDKYKKFRSLDVQNDTSVCKHITLAGVIGLMFILYKNIVIPNLQEAGVSYRSG